MSLLSLAEFIFQSELSIYPYTTITTLPLLNATSKVKYILLVLVPKYIIYTHK